METSYVKGVCTDMCPLAERELREKEKMIHILELSPDFKPDPGRMIKSFARSAAGKYMLDPKNLRTPEALLKTVNYLIMKILPNQKLPQHLTYDFIMDRFRSVRQDMVIQSLSLASSICILQPIVRFYAYASYSLCEEPLEHFDPHLNVTHLQECLKRLLCLYDECDKMFSGSDVKKSSFIEVLEKKRPLFEAMYIILNLGSTIALTRALKLPLIWRTELVRKAISLSLEFYRNNFVTLCRMFYKMQTILSALAAIHLPEIRRRAFKIMSVAYNSKNVTFPLDLLKEMYLYDNRETLVQDLKYFGFKVEEDKVDFKKSDYVEPNNAVPPRRLQFIDKQLLPSEIPYIILDNLVVML